MDSTICAKPAQVVSRIGRETTNPDGASAGRVSHNDDSFYAERETGLEPATSSGIYRGSGILLGRKPIPLSSSGGGAAAPRVGRPGQLPRVTVRADAPKPGTSGTRSGSGRSRSTFDGFSSVSSVNTSRNGAFGPDDQGGISGMVEQNIVSQFKPLSEQLSTLGAQLGDTLVNSISLGISTAIQSNSFGEGFRALTGSLLGGLGRMAIDFGTKSLNLAI